MGEDWDSCCPLCMEEMDSTDRQLKPCRCDYQICVWCWNHIMEMAEKDNTEGRCPACRTPYNKEKIVATACRSVEVNDRKQKSGKLKLKSAEGRKHLSNVRVIRRNLVYVVGIPISLADEEMLEQKEYFGQYGKILKISVSKPTNHITSPNVSIYITFVKEEDALQCIKAVNGYALEGKVLKACFGTTKYCNAWLKYMPCNNPECLYLHDEGTREDSFTKEEMLSRYGSKSQHFIELTRPPVPRSGVVLPPPMDADYTISHVHSIQGGIQKSLSAAGSFPKSSVLPSAASWGSQSTGTASRVIPTVKNSVMVASVKLKEGSGLVTLANSSLLSDSGNRGKAELVQPPVNNHSLLSTKADVPMQLARIKCAEPLPTGICFGLEDSNINSEFRRAISDESNFTSKSNVADVAVSDLVDTKDNVVEKEKIVSSRATDSVEQAIDSTDARILDKHINEAHNQMAMNISHCDSSCDMPIQLFDAEMADHTLENALQPKMDFFFSQTEACNEPSTSTGTATLHVEHDSKRVIDSSVNNSTGQTGVLLEDPLSESVSVNQAIMLTENNVQQTFRCSYGDEKLNNMKMSQTSKSLVNAHSEHELISNMFATGFDLWTDGNPQNLVQILFDGENAEPLCKLSVQDTLPSCMSAKSKQSRFHFARQGDISEEAVPSNVDLRATSIDRRVQEQNVLLNKSCFNSQVELSPTESFQNNALYAGESFAPSVLSSSKSFVRSPPGFSRIKPSLVPPPGFSQHSRPQGTRRISESSQDCTQSLDVPNMYNKLESIGDITNDVEFIDPAIMAVGRPEMRSTTPFIGNSSLAFVSEATPWSQLSSQPDYDKGHQPIQERTYSTDQNMTSMLRTGYSNKEDESSVRSLFHPSFSNVVDYKLLSGQYHDAQYRHLMQDSVYGNGTAKLRFQATPWDDWNRVLGVNSTAHAEAVGRLAISHMPMDQVMQSRLNELASNKEVDRKYHASGVKIHSGYGMFQTAQVGQFYL